MHIVDGVLSGEILILGAVGTIAGLTIGMRYLDIEKIPTAGMLSASFFVASLVHVPIGLSSVHLMLGGLAGIVLGWAAFPTLFIGLLLQAVFFGFGGLTVLGVNTLNIALPAVLMHYIFRWGILGRSTGVTAFWGGVGGGCTILLTSLFVAMALTFTGEAFWSAAEFVLVAHIPVAIIEALLTGAAVYLIHRVKPHLFAFAPT